MIVEEIQPFPSHQLHMLEVGIGTGILTGFLIKDIKDIGGRITGITGIDISFSMLKVASARHNLNLMESRQIHLINADAEKLPFVSDSFDVAFCVDALHHVENPIKVLGEMLRVIKVDGKVILIEPHAFFPANLRYIFQPVEWNTFKMTKRNLILWATQAGLENLRFDRPSIYFPPFPRFCFPIYDKLESAIKRIPLLSFFSTTTFLVGEKGEKGKVKPLK